jgi:hypothetical protein
MSDNRVAWAVSNRHIVGCAIALAPPTLALAGVIAPLTGLALVPLGYMTGLVVAPKSRAQRAEEAQRRDVEESLAELRRRIAGRIPLELSRKVGTISKTITDTLPRASALGAGTQGQYVLVACATDYLPAALQPYLDMPRQFADKSPVSGEKTAKDLLADQLDLLEREMLEIADAVNRADVDRLIVNGRFLDDRFGRRHDWPT